MCIIYINKIYIIYNIHYSIISFLSPLNNEEVAYKTLIPTYKTAIVSYKVLMSQKSSFSFT